MVLMSTGHCKDLKYQLVQKVAEIPEEEDSKDY